MKLEEITGKLFLSQITLRKALDSLLKLKVVKNGQRMRIIEILELVSIGILHPDEANKEIMRIWGEN
jgi:hypothetical protein